MLSMISTLRPDQQDSQKGLEDARSGVCRFEPGRPEGVLVCLYSGEIRLEEVRSRKVGHLEISARQVRPAEVPSRQVVERWRTPRLRFLTGGSTAVPPTGEG